MEFGDYLGVILGSRDLGLIFSKHLSFPYTSPEWDVLC